MQNLNKNLNLIANEGNLEQNDLIVLDRDQINPEKFINSGLLERSFFIIHRMEHKRFLSSLYLNNKEKDKSNIEKKLKELAAEYTDPDPVNSAYYEPMIYNEEIAYECGLIAFSTKNKQLLLIGGDGYHPVARLDTYQALVSNSIDKDSYLFDDYEYFEEAVGKELTQKVIKVLF